MSSSEPKVISSTLFSIFRIFGPISVIAIGAIIIAGMWVAGSQSIEGKVFATVWFAISFLVVLIPVFKVYDISLEGNTLVARRPFAHFRIPATEVVSVENFGVLFKPATLIVNLKPNSKFPSRIFFVAELPVTLTGSSRDDEINRLAREIEAEIRKHA